MQEAAACLSLSHRFVILLFRNETRNQYGLLARRVESRDVSLSGVQVAQTTLLSGFRSATLPPSCSSFSALIGSVMGSCQVAGGFSASMGVSLVAEARADSGVWKVSLSPQESSLVITHSLGTSHVQIRFSAQDTRVSVMRSAVFALALG